MPDGRYRPTAGHGGRRHGLLKDRGPAAGACTSNNFAPTARCPRPRGMSAADREESAVDVAALVGAWITGEQARSRPGRTLVVEADDVIEPLIAGDLLADCAGLFHRHPADLPAGLRGRSATFTGSFLAAESELRFDNGFRLRQSHYGTADFLPMDAPTVLRVSDDDDFSAFLRDADLAMTTGRFARGVSHPSTMVADVCGLGAPDDGAGPAHRIFIGPSGTVSTSPTGRQLGTAGEPWELIERRWRDANALTRRPCAVCLAGAVNEHDRSEALAERPWLAAYLEALRGVATASPDLLWPEADRSRHCRPGRS